MYSFKASTASEVHSALAFPGRGLCCPPLPVFCLFLLWLMISEKEDGREPAHAHEAALQSRSAFKKELAGARRSSTELGVLPLLFPHKFCELGRARSSSSWSSGSLLLHLCVSCLVAVSIRKATSTKCGFTSIGGAETLGRSHIEISPRKLAYRLRQSAAGIKTILLVPSNPWNGGKGRKALLLS